jgi:hypothetical protein
MKFIFLILYIEYILKKYKFYSIINAMEEVSLALIKVNPNHIDEVRKTLDKLFENCKTQEQKNELKFLLDDYLDEGYRVKSYVFKYNALIQRSRSGSYAFFPSNSTRSQLSY